MADSAYGNTGAAASVAANRELTAFIREVLLPGSTDEPPELVAEYCQFKLQCRQSKVHRWGVFTSEFIPVRRRVIEYVGERITEAEVWRRRFRKHIYIHWLPDRTAIDGGIGGSGAQAINHGCRPNVAARVVKKRIFLTSIRRIESGEELLLDYHLANNGIDIPCNCGDEDCRGLVNPVRNTTS